MTVLKTNTSHLLCRTKALTASAIALALLAGCSEEARDETVQSEAATTVEFQAPGNWDNVEGFQESKTDWYEDGRFGLFIHWGLYSEAAGDWQGERHYGITEWLMRRTRTNTEEYSALVNDFNPTEFDANEWIDFAEESGVKYIVITAKHHDGFAMYDSAVGQFDIVDATQFGRDPLKELADAAADSEVRLGFYYSQYQDWTDPNAGGNDWEFDPDTKTFSTYQETKALPQIEELLTGYGDVGIVWFDTPGDATPAESEAFANWVEDLQPATLVSSRVGNGFGDFLTLSDGEMPQRPITDIAWEAIYTHNDSWGYSRFDTNFKSTTDLLHKLATAASLNGNLMVNIGPDGNGNLPEGSAKRFRQVGAWLDKNGESIYGTKGSPVGPVPWGAITHRPGSLYLHVFHVPASGEIMVPYMDTAVLAAGVLESREPVTYRKDGDNLYISLPKDLKDLKAPVIRVDYDGFLADNEWDVPVIVSADPEIPGRLSPNWAEFSGNARAEKLSYYLYFGDWKHHQAVIGQKTQADTATWPLRVEAPGEYQVTLSYAANADSAGNEGLIEVGDNLVEFQIVQTASGAGDFPQNRPVPILDHHVGIVSFDKPGVYDLTIRPRQDYTAFFSLTDVTLRLVD
ncbi:alpha-L-fucosidase [Aquisalinus flavus]|uniref:alpha-L-fucosidase n=1 Tax=Aquisalinus flavus TaxID=1526572 RepID=A0A8J2V5X6_9PROT|nr:alpha-L-fucosidase [Aquisalinus flavus]MBD0425990.1 alpha-L-fucosidase [Aquisalinus flavus]UNE48418.1 alpha-L-fucosidase [Aquisalinus flavus]GGD11591.1 hypothetical protein GCM10011342_20500 [Aquisalinus flavus]